MRKEAIWNAVQEVGIHTRAVEALIESAIAELSVLQAKVVEVSNVAGLSYSTLQGSYEGVASTIDQMVKVRGAMAQCHEAFIDAKEFIPGVRTTGWGNGDVCCPPKTAHTDLRVVA
jgi:hypothetical protein